MRMKINLLRDYNPLCHCSEGLEPHYHCKQCNCILTGYEINVCKWCWERDHNPVLCGCKYLGNNLWSCGYIDQL
jgi:hypothetical protein